MTFQLSRRRFLTAASAAGSSLALSGCDAFDSLTRNGSTVRSVLEQANSLTYRVQRMLLSSDALAQEFSENEIRQPQRPNGVTQPADALYRSMSEGGFADYRLTVKGLVDKRLSLTLAEVQAMPARTQITRQDCVEGWSCIAKWTGVPLAHVLDQAKPKAAARFAVFQCFDTIDRSLSGDIKYYESIDLIDARHPQTILAYGLNGEALPVANGAPLRLRVERQLGYKMAKYVHTVELVESLEGFGGGKGGYWEDNGYDWFAGI
ncbi:MAG: molybdopterin-dependent oxidoreductase [Mesorhizobium sp.]|nr:molybdopterin-dependent oxidoreductase [Mesorhizobium sp.]MCO5163746.1 molybdopterin-dependent oxidoreductase [Mesorhizobium sp.]